MTQKTESAKKCRCKAILFILCCSEYFAMWACPEHRKAVKS